MEENMLMAFLCSDTPLLASRKRPQECLVDNGREGRCHLMGFPAITLTTFHARLLGDSRRCLVWLAGLQRSGKPARLPRRPAWGRVAETCVQTGSA